VLAGLPTQHLLQFQSLPLPWAASDLGAAKGSDGIGAILANGVRRLSIPR
jgi:hypothetical protein